jgi:hypothetical protein
VHLLHVDALYLSTCRVFKHIPGGGPSSGPCQKFKSACSEHADFKLAHAFTKNHARESGATTPIPHKKSNQRKDVHLRVAVMTCLEPAPKLQLRIFKEILK